MQPAIRGLFIVMREQSVAHRCSIELIDEPALSSSTSRRSRATASAGRCSLAVRVCTYPQPGRQALQQASWPRCRTGPASSSWKRHPPWMARGCRPGRPGPAGAPAGSTGRRPPAARPPRGGSAKDARSSVGVRERSGAAQCGSCAARPADREARAGLRPVVTAVMMRA